MTDPTISLEALRDILSRRLPLYRWRQPLYQWTMLEQLRGLWRPQDRRVLDIGGGTGVIAEAIKALFAVDRVVAVDVVDRFAEGLSVEAMAYDGRTLPFDDGAFDCVVFNNVLHHVPLEIRSPLMREARRVTSGGVIYIKDHLAASRLDHARLAALDMAGNLPFSGMVRARYLSQSDWKALAQSADYRIETQASAAYRAGVMAAVFPNRLEIAMRWAPA